MSNPFDEICVVHEENQTDDGFSSSEKKEKSICEVTDSLAREQMAIAEQVSPAISQAISPANGREQLTTETKGSKSCNQPGTGNEKPNCYKCKHRRDLIGDAHSSCAHPSSSPMALMMFAAGLTEFKTADHLHVRGNTHGIRSGWFMWPLNFDPVWLEICSGYDEIEHE